MTGDAQDKQSGHFALVLLGRRVRHARLKAGLSKDSVFASTGIATTRLANIENGYETARGSELFLLSQVYGISFGSLIADLSLGDVDGPVWVGEGSAVLGRPEEAGKAVQRIVDDREVRGLIKELATALSLVLP